MNLKNVVKGLQAHFVISNRYWRNLSQAGQMLEQYHKNADFAKIVILYRRHKRSAISASFDICINFSSFKQSLSTVSRGVRLIFSTNLKTSDLISLTD